MMAWWLRSCGILVPWRGIKSASSALVGGFLTTWAPGKSENSIIKVTFSLSRPPAWWISKRLLKCLIQCRASQSQSEAFPCPCSLKANFPLSEFMEFCILLGCLIDLGVWVFAYILWEKLNKLFNYFYFFNHNVPQWGLLLVESVWGPMSFMYLDAHISFQICEFFSSYFFFFPHLFLSVGG